MHVTRIYYNIDAVWGLLAMVVVDLGQKKRTVMVPPGADSSQKLEF